MTDTRKAEVRAMRKLEAGMRRSQRRREFKCWWTRPMRHEFVEVWDESGSLIPYKVCIGCGRGANG